MNSSKYTHRQILQVVVEAATPIAVGSGNKGILTDAPVLLDINGLPYIPGSSLAGVLRHAVGPEYDSIFGFQDVSSSDGHGSEIIFSEARMIGKDGTVLDGIQEIDWSDRFYSKFRDMPIRQHVRISSKGTPEDRGKFDGQVVYKGTRFAFEIELLCKADDVGRLSPVIEKLCDPAVRFGGGTRKGFGLLKIVKMARTVYNLTLPTDLESYLNKTSALTAVFADNVSRSVAPSEMIEYKLSLKPNDFFLFASGFGDDEADITPMREDFLQWHGDMPQWVTKATLIPATSLKGAISHRVAFHYNRLDGRFAGTDRKPLTGADNPAVRALFGMADNENAAIGNVIFSDIIVKDSSRDKLLNHVSIDRFTAAPLDGALFSEKVVYAAGCTYTTSIFVNKSVEDKKALEALECALDDLCSSLLPLGGGNNRGNGLFTGSYEKIC